MKPNKRLHLQKQTLRFLLDKQLSLARGGTGAPEANSELQPSVDAAPCDSVPCVSVPCGTTDTRGG